MEARMKVEDARVRSIKRLLSSNVSYSKYKKAECHFQDILLSPLARMSSLFDY